MSITLGTNIASLKGQRQLSKSSTELGTVFERLSSGQRINHASDDAAGLAIADSLRTNVRVYNQAQRNVSDGISVINIVDGALSSQKQILDRMSELAEQSANGVYSSKQRKELNREYQALIQEFDRIADTTTFNGKKILKNDDNESMVLQVGGNGEDTALLNLVRANSHSFSGTLGVRSNVIGGPGENDQLNYNYEILGIIVKTGTYMNSDFVNGYSDPWVISMTDSNGTEREVLFGINSTMPEILYYDSSSPYDPVTLSQLQNTPVNSFSLFAVEINEDGSDKNAIKLIANSTRIGNVFSSTNFINSFTFTFSDTGATATLNMDYSDATLTHLDVPGTVYQNTGGSPAAYGAGFGYLEILSTPVKESLIGATDVRFADHARHAIDVVKNRRDELSELQGKFGAALSRLDSIDNILSASSLNYAAAESRIRDADIASESSKLVRENILQQAASSVLGQANLQPELALTLLRA